MKCQTCEANIPPEWKSCIAKNECPGCSGPIMLPEAKQLLDELSEAMERMPNDPQGIAGWLLSNYEVTKIGEAKPVEKFHNKPKHQPKESNVPAGLKIAENPMQAFLARTGMQRGIQETGNKLAQMARGIAEVESEIDTESVEVEEHGEMPYDEDDGEIVERGPRISRKLVTGASLVDPSAPPLSPDEIAALANSVGQDQNDRETASEALKLQRFKRLKGQQAVSSGNGGLFRRS